ncbi:MAG: hypothetical protein QNJ47_03810 [Nostocaceae cyanobacterium]|nr:hypothetical protein [Nostocaceae cyanobacterium]
MMIPTLTVYGVILLYLMMAYRFFSSWLDFFIADEEMNSRERYFYGVVLIAASLLWLIVVPFAYLELLKFHKKHKAVIDFLINASNSGITTEDITTDG